ncbi:MAG: hypothetical protein HY519_02445 [Candidatus Aenigmarchaeota archaeon]|nr:hypothetical protein [Candidatus Aenigmarchaeota archaeon]
MGQRPIARYGDTLLGSLSAEDISRILLESAAFADGINPPGTGGDTKLLLPTAAPPRPNAEQEAGH